MKKDDLGQISKLLDDKLTPIHKELKQHGKLLKTLKRNQDTMSKMLDSEQMHQRRRLKRVEDHLGLNPLPN